MSLSSANYPNRRDPPSSVTPHSTQPPLGLLQHPPVFLLSKSLAHYHLLGVPIRDTCLVSGVGQVTCPNTSRRLDQGWTSELSLSYSAYTSKTYANNRNWVSRAADAGQGFRNPLAPSRFDFSSRPQCKVVCICFLEKCFKRPLISWLALSPDCSTADSQFWLLTRKATCQVPSFISRYCLFSSVTKT